MSYINKFAEKVKDNFIEFDELFDDVTVVGIGSLIYNGLSYRPIECNFSILTNAKWLDGYFSGIYKYIYLPDYNKSVGFEEGCSVPTAERAICDYILYSGYLPEFELREGLEFYMLDEEYGDIEKIYEMGSKLGISKSKLQYYLC